MKQVSITFCFLFSQIVVGQIDEKNVNTSFYFNPEFALGVTTESNTGFPKRGLQSGLFLNFGWYNLSNKYEWIKQLNYPKTGISFGITDYGNSEKLGQAFSVLPFIEFDIFKRWDLNTAIGVSYTNTQYDKINNPFNKAITTKLNWNFKAFIYYDLFKMDKLNWKLGFGYNHSSNGHSRLPNQGLNSFLAGVSTTFNSKDNSSQEYLDSSKSATTKQLYFSSRFDIGQNVLSEIFNDKKEVYSVAFSGGKIINKTFKFGAGFYYRFYEHYYDYIKNEEALITEEYPELTDKSFTNASTFGVFATSELLLSHIGFEFDIGFNFDKPFYKVDWKLNQGYSYINGQGDTVVVLGELDDYYKLKKTVSARLGLKYYLINNDKTPKHNVFLGAHINANLGQADFTALTLGYVYRFTINNK